jgi:putative addiction module CopG family antidote
MKTMEVELTPDQMAFVRQAIESGRLHSEEEAVQEALALWEERERARAEILAAVEVAEASLARGEGRIITQQSMRDLAAQVKQRGRERLAAEYPPLSSWPIVLRRRPKLSLTTFGITLQKQARASRLPTAERRNES